MKILSTILLAGVALGAAEHRPHSVQLYASIRFLQDRSKTSFAPNRGGGGADPSAGAGGAVSGCIA